jgi:hypothetical protein
MTDTREPIGDPDDAPADSADSGDFAGEHDDTAVDEDIASGDDQGETESPRGWAGLEP